MAAEEAMSSTLRLSFYDGDDEETGKPIYKYKNFNVHVDATADQLYGTAQAFAGLQERPLYSVVRNHSTEIRQ
ncbi:DUF1659 domain-containing protein [Virgibacillus sp. 179-BFC.A HS]|uniref:DUF1659 domain-containing protein n=1 Tax=Tigheibacillus jepli TaxID=3035914 RepID=A0ABU5CFV8_9BACI|nr:DUF1659 domain-containing protein [Virgibacillus sp. 179-BFC.A HS]MDY0404744.1 DUF1659 domain-containing protein [Virgibacillus sp. 179-BFC.A HS]MDY0405982.1 DUF1659 domain-containing protein [Virgibacillus sp. 179-BFC.A HS]